MKEFITYKQIKETITSTDNVFQMYVLNDGVWKFMGLVSENAKNSLQSETTITNLNSKRQEREILASFSGKTPEEFSLTYLFVKCENAEVSTFKPIYK